MPVQTDALWISPSRRCGIRNHNAATPDTGSRAWLHPFCGTFTRLFRLAIKYVITYFMFMKTTSYTNLRNNLAAVLDGLTDDCEPVLVTRGAGKGDVVMMSLDDFASYEETRYLLASKPNAAQLRKSIAELENGQSEPRELIE